MSPLLLDPNRPQSTCSSTDCTGCPLQTSLQCHFGGRELLRFFGIALLPFIFGGIGIARIEPWLIFPWIGLAVSYFGFIEIRVMCSHCPHYAEPDTNSLQCWANYGSPKLWKYRPGLMTRWEKIVFFTGLVIIAAYPLVCIIIGAQWLLLVLFIIATSGMAAVMGRLMCAHCMNFACPLNHVDRTTRELFFALNPVIAEAWLENE